MGFALNVQRDMFDTSPSFAKLAGWLDEPEWAFLALICAIVRLAALTVNGTFASFPYSPHIRIAASFLSGWFWFQFTAGFASAALAGSGAWSAVCAYSTLLILEAVNVYRSSKDLTRLNAG
ncbi:MAG: hypothetical protein CMJ32_10935 [Phycisphaerae bacterium]|nr:hypothetical protein [Phycisphaerae bacterium]